MPQGVDNIEQLKDIKIGELNDISFNIDDALITDGYDSESLLGNMMSAFLKRESAFNKKRPHKGIVLLSSKVQTRGIENLGGGLQSIFSFFGAGNQVRNFAIIRVPEIHGHIPVPDMNRLLEVASNVFKKSNEDASLAYAQLKERDKLLLSMHDPYFSSPIGSDDMVPLKPGDIVLLDGDGLIVKKVEDSEVGFFGRLKRSSARALDFTKAAIFGDPAIDPSDPSTYPGEASRDMRDLDPDFRSLVDAMLLSLEAKGFKFKVRETWRSAERQQFYLSRGWSNTPTSQHMNFTNGERASYAIDLLPDIPNVYTGVKANCIERNRETGEFSVVRDARGETVTGPAFSEEAAAYFIALRSEARNFGLRTGGEWFGSKICHGTEGLGWDPAHVQYPENKTVNAGPDADFSSSSYSDAESAPGDAVSSPTGEAE